ncbi:MAG: PD40 domain-containing protein [Deltaproteobacteria bacterium]|nr:PD40 domain-containing protein [Deltaproteobacteria bacterium]
MKKTFSLILVLSLGMVGEVAKSDFTFGEPTNMGPVINGADKDASLLITPDGLQMYFGSIREDGLGDFDLWMSTRTTKDDAWGEPVNLGESFNSPGTDLGPSLSADGLELYYSREDDLWVAKRASTNDPWGEPTNLGPTVNSEEFDCGPCISPDGLTLYFYSFLTYDGAIWMTTRPTVSDAWGSPVMLDSPMNTETLDYWPHITPDGLAFFFSSDREGGYGSNDVLMVRRSKVSHPWGPPINLGPPVNMTAYDACPYISSDGLTYYFASDRDGGQGSFDLWQAPIIPIVDFDGDSLIGMGDLMIMIENWGKDEPICDVGPMPWGDGIVDEADLDVLMSHWGQQVNYLNDPKQASRPTPLDHAISDVEQAVSIRWVPGRHAVQHDVYVGMDPVAVEDADISDTTGIYRGRQETNEYTLPEAVLPGQTFHWRIDELNTDATTTKGQVWSFSVADYLIVDDMESSEAAWARWWDGYGDPNNASEVATEFVTVHNGNQGMWLTYDNSAAPISRIDRFWETPQDWTRKGVETLILWLLGGPDNTAEPLQISLGDSADNVAVVVHPDPAVLLSDTWQEWSIPLEDVTGVNLTEITSMAIVIGDDATEEGGIGMLYIDDICLHPVSMQEMP